MTATVTKTGPYYSSGQISFSSLRNTFKEVSSGEIKVSELKRNTSLTNKNPTVPDATENSNISSSLNLKLSQFRNSIKYYYITQTGTDINFDIASQSWNSNINKNIVKILYITGACGSNTTSSPAAFLNTTVCNLTLRVSGGIYGAGGGGGNSSTISGGNGGNALSLVSANANNLVVDILGSSNIYGGGGGGEYGANGSNGSSGTCINYSQYTTSRRCRSCPNCDSGYTRIDCYNREGRCQTFYQYRRSVCKRTDYNTVSGGPGGVGGNGANGRGYNNLSSSLGGSSGTAGSGGGCGGYASNGSPIPTGGSSGETGGNGGDWGSNGSPTTNIGSGGIPGRSISGQNYTIIGTINSSTIKGLYNP